MASVATSILIAPKSWSRIISASLGSAEFSHVAWDPCEKKKWLAGHHGGQTTPHPRSCLLKLFLGKRKGHISDFRCFIVFSAVSAWGSLGKTQLAFWWFLILSHKWCVVCHKTETSTSADSIRLFPFPWVSALPGVCTKVWWAGKSLPRAALPQLQTQQCLWHIQVLPKLARSPN